MKTCIVCGLTKPLEDFQKRARNKDGYTNQCKLCKRAYDNAHYASNPDRRTYIRSNSDRRRLEVKEWLREYLSTHSCVDCEESDIIVLEFDHLDNKVANIADMIKDHSLVKVKEEVAKCDVRCANCHRRKTARDFGSWRIASKALK